MELVTEDPVSSHPSLYSRVLSACDFYGVLRLVLPGQKPKWFVSHAWSEPVRWGVGGEGAPKPLPIWVVL